MDIYFASGGGECQWIAESGEMGRKIPAKKHHGTKDPEKQKKARLDKIKMKVKPLVSVSSSVIVPDQRAPRQGGPPGGPQVAAHDGGRTGADQGNGNILAVFSEVRPGPAAGGSLLRWPGLCTPHYCSPAGRRQSPTKGSETSRRCSNLWRVRQWRPGLTHSARVQPNTSAQ